MLSILDKIKLWRKFLELNRDPLVRYLKAKEGHRNYQDIREYLS